MPMHHQLATIYRTIIFGALAIASALPHSAAAKERTTNADRAFLAWDIQIEIQQQDMGHLAEKRARTPQVRDLGRYLVERHQQMQQRLQQVADQLGISLSHQLSELHLRVQRHYATIPDAGFDGAFVRHEIGDYHYFLSHFEAAATSGTGLVKTYAASEIPQLKEDQSKITALPH